MYNELCKHPQVAAIPSLILALIGIFFVPNFGYACSCALLPLVSAISALFGILGIRASLGEPTKRCLWLSLLGTVGALICFRIFFTAWDHQLGINAIQ